MNEQELVHELNHVENERAMWKATAIKCGFEKVALKAQVNCLIGALEAISECDSDECKGLSLIAKIALETTPEQCLAEVKAQAIKEMVKNFNKDYFLGTNLLHKIENYTKELLEQAK